MNDLKFLGQLCDVPVSGKKFMRPNESELFAKITNTVIDIAPRDEIELPRMNLVVVSMYQRSISLFRGVLELLKSDLVEEALILSRSLFTESIRLMEISKADERRRGSLILGWVNHSYEEIKGLFEEAHRMGIDPNAKDVVARYEQEQRELQNYARRHDIGRFKKFRNEDEAAKQFGRQDDYWTFLLSHEMVHGSDAAYVFRRKKIDKDTIVLFSKTADSELVASIGVFAARSLLDSAKATAKILAWPLPGHFDMLYKQLESLVEKKDVERGKCES